MNPAARWAVIGLSTGIFVGALSMWLLILDLGWTPPSPGSARIELAARRSTGCPPIYRGRILVHSILQREEADEALLTCLYRVPGAMLGEERRDSAR